MRRELFNKNKNKTVKKGYEYISASDIVQQNIELMSQGNSFEFKLYEATPSEEGLCFYVYTGKKVLTKGILEYGTKKNISSLSSDITGSFMFSTQENLDLSRSSEGYLRVWVNLELGILLYKRHTLVDIIPLKEYYGQFIQTQFLPYFVERMEDVPQEMLTNSVPALMDFSRFGKFQMYFRNSVPIETTNPYVILDVLETHTDQYASPPYKVERDGNNNPRKLVVENKRDLISIYCVNMNKEQTHQILNLFWIYQDLPAPKFGAVSNPITYQSEIAFEGIIKTINTIEVMITYSISTLLYPVIYDNLHISVGYLFIPNKELQHLTINQVGTPSLVMGDSPFHPFNFSGYMK